MAKEHAAKPAHQACTAVAPLMLLALVFFTIPADAQGLIRNYTPPKWQAEDVQWSRDVNPHNGIDDLLEEAFLRGEQTVDVVVNFKRCVEPEDSAWLDDLTPSSTVQMKLKYISSVAVGGLTAPDLQQIAADPRVAFIEGQWDFTTLLDISMQAIKVIGPQYVPNVQSKYPAIDGSGVNIVIMDTGVDDVQHDAFNATPYVAGYNAFTKQFVNPDDDQGHGTHVASTALGQAFGTSPNYRGVAPAAGLIDVKVCNSSGMCPWVVCADALQVVYDNRNSWDADVINMSFGGGYDDGTSAFSQMVDLAEAMGIVIVAAVGNSGPSNAGIGTPAAATRAITVANSNDQNTADRTDDAIWSTSSRGKRQSDFDQDKIDELKPEVAAPGRDIRAAYFNTTAGWTSKTGSSMSAPHVSGLAALILEAQPNINPASVKDLIIRTAERRGTPTDPPADPEWNREWGWGLIDAFAAIDQALTTDLKFPSHPPTPSWLSPDLSVVPYPPKVGQPATVTAQIRNAGPAAAINVHVHFGVHVFSAATPTFQDIGTVIIPNFPVGQQPVSIQWTPAHASHQCLTGEIGYGPDMDYSNNKAQRNITVATSPVPFQVKNTLSDDPAVV